MDTGKRALAILGVAILATACGGSSGGSATSGSGTSPGVDSGATPTAAVGGSSGHGSLKMTGQLTGPLTASVASCPEPGNLIAQLKSPQNQTDILSVSNVPPGTTTVFPKSASLALVALREGQLVWEASGSSGSGVVNVAADGHSITFSVQLDPSKDPTLPQHPTSSIGLSGTILC
jgi:hypothetical protein